MPTRITSIDAYRGFVMLLMMAEVLSFEKVSAALPESGFWHLLAWHQSHVEWVGCSLHDMIQPSFSFLVGVALPYSITARMAKGDAQQTMLLHALKRSLILIFLGIFLRSMHAQQTYFTFEDTLTQIGLGYFFLFLLGFRSVRVQLVALGVLLVGYYLAFVLYTPGDFGYAQSPGGYAQSPGGFDQSAGGGLSVAEPRWLSVAETENWNKNTNLAWAFDRWFLNLFPRESPFLFNGGGYATLSFIPTLGTMILGLLAGQELKNDSPAREKIRLFMMYGAGLVVVGWLLGVLGICPVVKRIWTPSWTLFSGGLCCFFLAFFYWTADVLNGKKWYYVLVVIGANSIAAYVMAHTIDGFIASALRIHLGQNYAACFGEVYAPLVQGLFILLFEWLILWWMYRKRIFIKI